MPKVLLAPVAQPHAQYLGHFLAFDLTQGVIERQGFLTLTSAGAVVVRIPETASQADAAASFLDQCRSGERLVVVFFFRRHGHPSDSETESRKTRPCIVLPMFKPNLCLQSKQASR